MGSETSQPSHRWFKRVVFFLKMLEIRLRFIAILVVTALVVGYWDYIENYYERWQRHRAAAHGGAGHVEHKADGESDIEYYCGMHPFVIRDRPGKCPICGMDLTKRKKGAPAQLPEGTLSRVQISPERIMQAGVQIEAVAYRLLTRTVRSYGVLELDETRQARIVARFPGRVEELMVNATGQTVKAGEPLARIYSPKFMAASQEYLQALSSQRKTEASKDASAEEKARAAQLAVYARQRLKLAGFMDKQLDELARGSAAAASEYVTLYSPLPGTVLEKNVLAGQTVEEGTVLYSVADLSSLWAQIQVIESDIGAVAQGMAVEISSVSRPGEIFYGTVDFIYPTLDTASRSLKVRVVIPNAGDKLKPGMYVTAVLRAPMGKFEQGVDEGAGGKARDAKDKGTATSASVKLPTANKEDAERYIASLAVGAEYYDCPMHSEAVSNKATDICALCGMKTNKKHIKEEKKSLPPSSTTQTIASPEAASESQWAEGYTCPMHPAELSDHPGICTLCNCAMKMTKWRVERVLSIPETAVIDTGARQIVFVESAPGLFDARAVTLGPRSGAYYFVRGGLQLGQRIATYGSFLIDAEARLNPNS
ncbi:MAG: efflux RND transporter periplasmic adaptor subunit [Candidatus Sumerlaeota bacterium]|nr:efflux RND transporter periplasmic adaptor subunit [Candidatus Sumerlaeota bacterium]